MALWKPQMDMRGVTRRWLNPSCLQVLSLVTRLHFEELLHFEISTRSLLQYREDKDSWVMRRFRRNDLPNEEYAQEASSETAEQRIARKKEEAETRMREREEATKKRRQEEDRRREFRRKEEDRKEEFERKRRLELAEELERRRIAEESFNGHEPLPQRRSRSPARSESSKRSDRSVSARDHKKARPNQEEDNHRPHERTRPSRRPPGRPRDKQFGPRPPPVPLRIELSQKSPKPASGGQDRRSKI